MFIYLKRTNAKVWVIPKYRKVHGFQGTEKVQKKENCRTRSDIKSDTENKRALWDPLETGELTLVLAEKWKKK